MPYSREIPAALRLGAALLLLAATTSAATYFVAPDGVDSAAGTIDAPWRTLQRAADHPPLAGGDTIYLRGGTYTQRITLSRSGLDSARPITLAAYPGEKPLLDGSSLTPPNDSTGLVTVRNASHLRIIGLELAHYRATGAATNQDKVPCGIFVQGACRGLTVRGNNIHHISNHFADGNAFGLAVYGDSDQPVSDLVVADNEIHHCQVGNSESLSINGNVDGFIVSDNMIHDNTNIGIVAIGYEGTFPGDPGLDRARNGLIRGNSVWECTSSANPAYTNQPCAGGIYVDGGTSIVIENNTSYRNDIGIELASEHEGRTTDHITARNNFIWGNRIGGIFLGGSESGNGGAAYNQVQANTLWDNDTRADGNGEIQFNHWCHHNTLRHNLVFAGAQALLCSNPVAATVGGRSTSTDNQLDWNLWWSPGGATTSEWQWKDTSRTGFAAWKTTTGGDSHSLFTEPRLRNASLSGTTDLHLRPDSPAIDAGAPDFAPAIAEADIDRQDRVTRGRIDLGADEVSPYAAWRLAHFGPAETAAGAPNSDPDHDNLSNILEYAAGGDPLAAASRPLPTIGIPPAALFSFVKAAGANDLTYRIQSSTNLADWTDASTYSPFGNSPSTLFTRELSRTAIPAGVLITLEATPPNNATRFFLRLAVSLEATGP